MTATACIPLLSTQFLSPIHLLNPKFPQVHLFGFHLLPYLSATTNPNAHHRSASNSLSAVKSVIAAAKKHELAPEKIDDALTDPQMCEAYVCDIYEYLHNMEIEVKRRPLVDYIEKVQKDVTVNIMGVLVDWLVEVAEEYKLGHINLSTGFLQLMLYANGYLVVKKSMESLAMTKLN